MNEDEEIEKLIELALNGPDDSSPFNGREREVNSWLQVHNTVEATNPIPGKILYELFKKENPKSHVGSRTFYNILNKRYPKHYDGSITFFRLNPTCFGLPPSYSLYTDPKFRPRTSGKPRKHRHTKPIKGVTDGQEEEQEQYRKQAESFYSDTEDAEE
jgi:hypothetical protein